MNPQKFAAQWIYPEASSEKRKPRMTSVAFLREIAVSPELPCGRK